MRELAQFRTLCCSNLSITTIMVSLLSLVTSCSESLEKRPSPLRSDSLQIGQNTIRIQYSSPRVKGRKIFGNGDDFLEQYGEIWRTGANEATIFSTEENIKIDTFDLPKGKYALFTIPNEESWEIILNKEWNQWGAHNHQASLDAVRLFVEPVALDSIEEHLKFSFTEDALNFKWDMVGWSIPISSNE